ncbi:helix-turn-helix transcriptional regulator [Brumimicrobium mesophilum]|uniref:helix-turn-helix domain-containing protein n=1 Tax=Brumimicrobium mesophilum TaxID=392717 RepID=UPI000D140BBA|nr:helix-turn-helix domain-containing protein [Brumimicrobium mesophilum]
MPQSKFDSLYLDIAINLRINEPDRALIKTDSLFNNSQTHLQRIKCALLTALLYENQGELAMTIYWATKSEQLSIENKNYEYVVRSSGYLATLYRRIGLSTESDTHLENAEKANAQRKNEPNYHSIQSVIHHEKAANLFSKRKYNESLIELDKSKKCLENMEETKMIEFNMSSIFETYIDCYLKLNDNKSAREKAEQGLQFDLDNYPSLLSIFHSSMGNIEMNDQNYDKALEHLIIARETFENIPNLVVQTKVLEVLVRYYKETGDVENTLFYSDKLTETRNKRDLFSKKVTNELLLKMHKKNETTNSNNYLLILVVTFLVLLMFVDYYSYRFKLKKQHIKYKTLLNKLDTLNKVQTDIENSKKIAEEKNSEKSIMPIETESRLLEKLNLLEAKNFFLDKDISLSSLTVEMNSNTKYVSYIINTYKENDFKNYINELRILYVIGLMRSEPEYLKYKISYIAEMAGFSSHSKFASVFKKVTDLTPSSFITELEKGKFQENLG